AIAAAHRLLEIRRASAVLGIERQDQPVEEAAAIGGRAGEEPVHGGRQPDDAQMVEKLVDGAGRRAVEPELSRLAVLAALRAGADIHLALHSLQRREDGEASL